MSQRVSTGNIIRYINGCRCGRVFETDNPDDVVPDHTHNHRLVSDGNTHTCAGCTWTVETYTPPLWPTTDDAIRKAFATHLLATAIEEAQTG